MHIQFENRYYSDDAMVPEYVHKVLCRRIYFMGAVFIPIALIMTGIMMSKQNYIMTAVFGVCLFIITSTILITPPMAIRQLREIDYQLHNGKKPEAVIQFGEHISITQGTFSLTIEYFQIIKTYELKHSFVLMFAKNNGIIIDPAGFNVGCYNEFKEFIRIRCIN
ncbi:YcxB family protein [Clostridium boliviensis]|uniref:YcxB family protein n=1 Tax=Clostridium boliviensis TaxID=318465 RepID=A0ABU4GM13_9CLOT|nr:YcxB family protein [Clostridium boliviensis]MDW2798634.1 YcxB family protein [Clostridium boliviensis]